jgi:predicted phosphodiesterase
MSRRKGLMSVDELVGQVQPAPEVAYLKDQVQKRDAIIERLRAELGGMSDVAEMFEQAIRCLPEPTEIKIERHKELHAPSEFVLMLTDLHAGERVVPSEMEGYGEYNWGIMKSRLWKTLEKTVELVNIKRHACKCDRLTVMLGGDFVTGDIHDELDRTAELSLPLTIVELGDLLAQSLTLLSSHFAEVHVFGVCGNHGRKDKKPVAKQRADRNWDTSAYHIARKITRVNGRIMWTLPRSPACIVDIAGCRFLLKHGDNVAMAGGVTPYYGLARDTAREYQKRRGVEDFDYVLQGHLHHWGLSEGNRILAPSLIGPNEFSCNLLHSVFPPAQLLLECTEQNNLGLISQQPIWLAGVIKGHGFLKSSIDIPSDTIPDRDGL